MATESVPSSAPGTVILEMKGITKRFPGVTALRKVDFQLRAGEVHVLLGENGAGKSTLIKILTGAYQDFEGEIVLFGKGTRINSPEHAIELGIRAVYQEFNLIPQLDAGRNIFLGEPPRTPVLRLIDHKQIYRRSTEYFKTLGVKIDPRVPVRRLGIASQQMVEISKTLATDARLVVFDEPTAVLTTEEIEHLFTVIRGLTQRGVGVIYISHRLEEIFKIGDRATILRDGEFVATRDLRDARVDIDGLIQLMVGRRLTEKFPKFENQIGAELLRVEHLERDGVLHDISLALRSGEILGIAGLVGAGRTELAKAIFGADRIDSGSVFVEGRPVRIGSPGDAIGLGIGLAPEDRKAEGLVQLLPVDSNIIMACVRTLTRLGVIGRKKKIEITERLAKGLRIATPALSRKVMFLSGGNQQKVVLAKWLASGSRIIIFDEPTRGIDVGAKIEVYNLMNDLIREGVGIIMISSELPELLGMADRILVMHEGRMVAEYPRAEATQEKILLSATGGTEIGAARK
jgi:ribose transport system ATP-binding protein